MENLKTKGLSLFFKEMVRIVIKLNTIRISIFVFVLIFHFIVKNYFYSLISIQFFFEKFMFEQISTRRRSLGIISSSYIFILSNITFSQSLYCIIHRLKRHLYIYFNYLSKGGSLKQTSNKCTRKEKNPVETFRSIQ